MPVLETHALTRRFGTLTAVDNLTIAIDAGEVCGLLGRNGAGKTTVIKMLTTLLPPSSGTARVGGFDVVRQAASVRRIIGYVPQLVSADGSLTGRENLLMFAKLYDIPTRDLAARVGDALKFMGLSDVGDRLVRTYSGGMIRRLEIAQAVLHRPAVVFLDEPTVGLDPLARESVWNRVEQLRTEYGTTILLTTHDMQEAETLCTRLAIMHTGRVVADGTVASLKDAVGPEATLSDVFVHHTGTEMEISGGYRETARTRRVARRLG